MRKLIFDSQQIMHMDIGNGVWSLASPEAIEKWIYVFEILDTYLVNTMLERERDRERERESKSKHNGAQVCKLIIRIIFNKYLQIQINNLRKSKSPTLNLIYIYEF